MRSDGVRRDTINYTLVGAVVAIALAVLLGVLAVLGGRTTASSDYFVHLRNVTGLRLGAPVFYEGYRVGQVAAVEPERSAQGTRFRVTLAVRRDWAIPLGSVARLQASGLLADMAVGIREGAGPQALAPGGELQGAEGADLFVAMNELAGQLSELTRTQISPLLRTLGQRVDSITGTIDDKAPRILEQTSQLLDNLTRASAGLDALLKADNRAAVETILGNARALSGELRATRGELDAALAEFAAIARDNRADVRRSVQDLATVMASLSSRIEVITHHLDSASRNIDEFSREVRRNPGQLIRAPQPDALEDER